MNASSSVSVWQAPRSSIRGPRDRIAVVLQREGKTIIVDPGVLRWQSKLLASFPHIDEIWLTHAHPDHCAVAGVLQSRFGCRVFCSEREIKIVQNPGQFLQTEYEAAGLFKDEIFPRYLQPLDSAILHAVYGRWPSANVDATFESLGMKRYDIEALYLPGHAQGSIAFWFYDSARKYLVKGDLLQKRAGGEPVLSLNLPRSDLDAALASLQRIRSLQPDILIPAHGDAIEGAGAISSAIDDVIRKYRAYEEQILLFTEARQAIPHLAHIARKVPFPWPRHYPTSFTQNRSLVFAVLKSLYRQGRLSARLQGLEKLRSVR